MTARAERPWKRIDQPPELPPAPTTDYLHRMPDSAFSELLRAHLVPRGNDSQDRQRWDRFWQVLNADEALNDRAFDELEAFRAVTESASPSSEPEARRMARFLRQVMEAQNRLDWHQPDLGPAVAARLRAYPSAPRRHLTELITAIDAHRAETMSIGDPTDADRELWSTLSAVGLDPRA